MKGLFLNDLIKKALVLNLFDQTLLFLLMYKCNFLMINYPIDVSAKILYLQLNLNQINNNNQNSKMSRRLTNLDGFHSKDFNHKSTKLKPGMTGKIYIRDTTRVALEPLSHTAKRNAYDRIKKIQNIQRQKGSSLSYEQIFHEFRLIVKDDIEMAGIFPDQWKTQNGRAMLADGTFYVALAKINIRYQYTSKKMYLANLKDKYLPKVTQNKTMLANFLEEQTQKIQNQQKQREQKWLLKQAIKQQTKKYSQKDAQCHQQNKQKQEQSVLASNLIQKVPQEIKYPDLSFETIKQQNKGRQFATITSAGKQFATMTSAQKDKPIRKSILKLTKQQGDKRKSVHWNQISDCLDVPVMDQVIQANKQFAASQKKQTQNKLRKQKLDKIRLDQSFLIDFFEINDVYESDMIEVIGIIDEIEHKYVVMLIRQKLQTPVPSYVKTRRAYQQQNQHKKQAKEKRQMLAIGLLQKVQIHNHDTKTLRQIEKNHPNIFAYVQIDNPQAIFFNSLPNEGADGDDLKKQRNI